MTPQLSHTLSLLALLMFGTPD